jgi:peptidoglycan hydrolase-like protein with peptidoglycan-binding domain
MTKSVLPVAVLTLFLAAPALTPSAMAQQRQTQPRATLQQSQLAPVRDVLAAAQQRLQQMGYDVKPDGRFDAQTRNGVLRFQADHGLRPTGNVDLETLAALGLDVEPTGRATAAIPREPGQQYAMVEETPQVAAAPPPPRYVELAEVQPPPGGNAVGEAKFVNPHIPLLRFHENMQSPQISGLGTMTNMVGIPESSQQWVNGQVGAVPAGVFLDTATGKVWN